MNDQRKSKAQLIEELTTQRQEFAKLQQREEHLRLARELSLDAFTILRSVRDADGNIVDFEWEYANPAAATFLRRPIEALVGHRLLSVLPGNQTSSALFAEYVRVAETGVPMDRELYYNADGIDGWFLHKTVKLGDGVANFFSDVTARKRLEALERQRSEEMLQASEDRWQLALRGSNAGIWDWNPQTNEVFFSSGWKTMLGFSEDEIGNTLKEWSDRVHPEDLPHVRRALEEHFARKTEFYESEHRVRCKDGSYKWILDRGQALWDAHGNVMRAVGSHADISERKRSEAWLQSLIDTTQDAVISIDRQARIVLFNPAAEKIFGHVKEEVIGHKINMLMAEPYASEHDGYIVRYEQTGEPQAIGRIRTVMARRKNGQLFPIELSVTEIAMDDEVHYAAFIRDISERIRLQEQLLERERLATIGTTAAKLAHEIGNPLNGMAMSVQMLERRLASTASDEKVVERVHAFRQQIARLTQLLHEFRSLSRRQQYDLKPTNLAAVAASVLESEATHYRSKGVRVEHHFPGDLPQVMVDSSKLTQVLVNLCKNAVEAMPDGGTLTVRGANSGGQVTLEVCDTGTGIPEDVDIFEPFITTKSEGSGLGLPIVRQLIAGHGGTLTYRSESGKGTTFIISLPVLSVAQSPRPCE